MKVLIYSDMHLSSSSSIQRGRGKELSDRLNSIIQIRKEIESLADKYDVQLIIDAGDILDSDTITSEELFCISEYLKIGTREEIHLMGNHGLSHSNINAGVVMSSSPNHKFINKVTSIGDFLFIPYGQMTDDIEFDKKFTISHEVVTTSDFFKGNKLDMLSSKDSVIFNGHIHSPRKMSKNIYNVGSSSGCNFGDGHVLGKSVSYPSILILDTETNDVKRVVLKTSNLFFKTTREEVLKFDFNKLKSHNVFINCEIKDSKESEFVKEYVSNFSSVKGIVFSLVLRDSEVSAPTLINDDLELLPPDEYVNSVIKDILIDKYGESNYSDYIDIMKEEFHDNK